MAKLVSSLQIPLSSRSVVNSALDRDDGGSWRANSRKGDCLAETSLINNKSGSPCRVLYASHHLFDAKSGPMRRAEQELSPRWIPCVGSGARRQNRTEVTGLNSQLSSSS